MLRQSALDLVRLLCDPQARSAAFRSHGVLPRLLDGLSQAVDTADDPVYTLALAGILCAFSHDELLLDD